MDKNLVLLAAVGVGAYLLLGQRGGAAGYSPVSGGYQVRGGGAVGVRQPQYQPAPSRQGAIEAAAYQNVGSLIGGIYSKVFKTPGNGGQQGIVSGELMGPPYYPDDGYAANPPGNVDPYSYESELWA